VCPDRYLTPRSGGQRFLHVAQCASAYPDCATLRGPVIPSIEFVHDL
jgi:hypothetical protein